MAATHQDGPFYKHSDHPEWGFGIVLPPIPGRLDRFDLSFETGGRRILLKTHSGKLIRATVSVEEGNALQHKLTSAKGGVAPAKKKRAPRAAKAKVAKAAIEAAPVVEAE